MKKRILNCIVPAVSAVVSVLVTLSLFFGVKEIPLPQKSAITDGSGNEIYGVCIADLAEKNRLPYAYYTPNEFVVPAQSSVTGEYVDLTKQKKIAKRGTYQFIVYNIDPEDENFTKKRNRLSPYLQSDNLWHFALSLPPCFSACHVYVNSVLTASAGEIADYDYIAYSEKQGYNEKHSDGTQPIVLDLTFYTRRQAIGTIFLQRAKIITVHYESEGGKVGFDGVPVIGETRKVNRILSADKTFLTIAALAAAFVFAILAFACILKKSLFALPQALLVLGVAGFMFFKLLLYSLAKTPHFISACIPICVVLILIAATLSLVYAIKMRKTDFLIAPPIAVTFAITYFCIPFSAPVLPNPLMWLAVVMWGLTTVSAFGFFAEVERRNVYLTNNLKSEVTRQTEDLKTIVNERDKLLRYLSHDMKKPLSSIKNFTAEIRKNETNAENVKALDIIDGKIDGLQTDFAELQRFAKLHFAAEEGGLVYADEIVQDLCTRLSPDCEANGITLKSATPHIAVFAKRRILQSVLDNLVLNAVEHASCKTIDVAATKSAGVCRMTVSDDGAGIEDAHNIFMPYSTETPDSDNLGLGLYICRQHLLSMGGDLSYARENDKTVFTILLPLA